MELFEKTKELSELIEKANKLLGDLEASIRQQFVELPYKMTKVEACYPDRIELCPYGAEGNKKIKVYYPILEQPQGFEKEKEEFYRKCANGIVHEYTLTDKEGRKIKIEEETTFTDKVTFKPKHRYFKNEQYIGLKCGNIASERIEYKIEIEEKEYSIARNILHTDMIEQIISPNEIATIISSITDLNAVEERKFQLFMRKIGVTQNITSLDELRRHQQGEIKVSDVITLKVAINTEPIKQKLCLAAENFYVSLIAQEAVNYSFEITPYVGGDMKLETQNYTYCDISEGRWKKGITVSEAIGIITGKEKE